MGRVGTSVRLLAVYVLRPLGRRLGLFLVSCLRVTGLLGWLVSRLRVSRLRVSRLRVSWLRVSRLRVSWLRVSWLRVSWLRVSLVGWNLLGVSGPLLEIGCPLWWILW